MQHEIAIATEEVMHKYNNKHPLETRTGKGVWDVMKNTTAKAIGSIKGMVLEKLLALGNPTNGEEFFMKILFLHH